MRTVGLPMPPAGVIEGAWPPPYQMVKTMTTRGLSTITCGTMAWYSMQRSAGRLSRLVRMQNHEKPTTDQLYMSQSQLTGTELYVESFARSDSSGAANFGRESLADSIVRLALGSGRSRPGADCS